MHFYLFKISFQVSLKYHRIWRLFLPFVICMLCKPFIQKRTMQNLWELVGLYYFIIKESTFTRKAKFRKCFFYVFLSIDNMLKLFSTFCGFFHSKPMIFYGWTISSNNSICLIALYGPKYFICFAVEFPNYWQTSRKTPSPSLRKMIPFIKLDFSHLIDHLILNWFVLSNYFVSWVEDTILVWNVFSNENYLFIKFTKEAYWRAFIKRPSTIYAVFYPPVKMIIFFHQPHSTLW